jgi:uncharacterized glyoxalase superfamily protein PhnB
MSEEIYPMPFFVNLSVSDLMESSKWYQEALGFRHIFTIPGPGGAPALVHLRWIKYADVLLRRDTGAESATRKGAGVTLNFNVFEGSVDDIAARARQAGAKIISEPKNQPWNVRDFSVADPDGFVLTFSQGPVEQDLGMEKIIERSRGTA